MKKRFMALATSALLVITSASGATVFAETDANTEVDTEANYMQLSKSADGKTESFLMDFESTEFTRDHYSYEPTRIGASTNNPDYSFYVSNYGNGAGEWNAGLNRAAVYATQNTAEGVAKGQLYNGQWTTDQSGKTVLNANGGTNQVLGNDDSLKELVPTVKFGGEYFPEITAFSGYAYVANGKPYFATDEELTAKINSYVYNGTDNSGKWRNLMPKGDMIDNLSVVKAPKEAKDTASNNYAVRLSASGMDAGKKDYSAIGKTNLDLAGRSTKFSTRVYVESDKTIDDATNANTKPFSVSIAKNIDLSYLDNTNYESFKSDGTGSASYNISRMASVDKNTQYYDAVTFSHGSIYLGSSTGTKIGDYTAGKWYTVNYYLDTTGATAVNALEVLDEWGTLIGAVKEDVKLGDYGSFGYIAGDNTAKIAERQSGYKPFDGFDADSEYSIFVRTDTVGYDNAVDFSGYVDDISFGAAKMREDNTSSKFFNSFEGYDPVEYTKNYYNYSSDAVLNVAKAGTGLANVSALAIKNGQNTMYKDSVLSAKEGDLYPRPNTSHSIDLYDREKMTQGGLPGYLGYNANNGSFAVWSSDNAIGGRATKWVDDLQVVNINGNKKLVLHPIKAEGFSNQQTQAYSSWSSFGREKVDILGRNNVITATVNVNGGNDADAFRLSFVKGNKGTSSYETSARKIEQSSMAPGNAHQFMPNKAWYDAVTFYKGYIYLGNVGESTTNLNSANVVCAYEEGKDYRIVYYIDLTDATTPKNTLVVYDENDVLIGKKSAAITLGSNTTTTLNNVSFNTACSGATGNRQPAQGGGQMQYFTSFDSNSDYAVLMTYATAPQAGSFNEARAYIDNFGLSEAAADEITLSGSINYTTVSATVSPASLEGTKSAVLIAAVYDRTTGEMIGAKYESVSLTANTDVTKTFNFDSIPENARVSLYLWDGLTTLGPVSDVTHIR